MSREQKPISGQRFPTRSLSLVVGLTSIIVGMMGWNMFGSYQMIQGVEKHELKILELRGVILRLDEVLTMSARMSAATGDLSWEARYREHEPQLDSAIKQAIRLSPDPYMEKAAAQIDKANLALVEMAYRSFERVRAHRKEEAQQILYGEDYEVQKQVYTEGIRILTTRLRESSEARLRDQEKRVFLYLVLLLVILPLLCASWVSVLRAVRSWRIALISQTARILEQSQQLTELNRTLDQKVAERTKELQLSRLTALSLMEDAVEAKRGAEQTNVELIQTQQRLVQSEKLSAMGRLSFGVAHEIKNPLGIILSWTEFLERKTAKDNPETAEALGKVKDAVLRADAIIRGLLQFSRPASFETERVRIPQVISEALSLLESKLGAMNVEVEKEIAGGEEFWVQVDKNQIQQVFFNVLLNAAEAMPRGGKILLKAAAGPGGDGSERRLCAVEVSDNGEGIPRENLSKIFEPFFTTKRDRKGTGLGLSVSKMIVENHRGEMFVESQLGKGTTVKIVLPLA